MIPDEVLRVKEYLESASVDLPTTGQDTRVDSALAEDRIVSVLQNHFPQHGLPIVSGNVGGSTNRNWYDVRIADYYCNIKVSGLGAADNANAKKAIFYFLTGVEPVAENGFRAQEEKLFPMMRANENPNEAIDYYYLVVNKNDPADIIVTSLKGLTSVTSNLRNPPFQCRWNDNREVVTRTWREAKDFLLRAWADSIAGTIRVAIAGMPTTYPEYFSEHALRGFTDRVSEILPGAYSSEND